MSDLPDKLAATASNFYREGMSQSSQLLILQPVMNYCIIWLSPSIAAAAPLQIRRSSFNNHSTVSVNGRMLDLTCSCFIVLEITKSCELCDILLEYLVNSKPLEKS